MSKYLLGILFALLFAALTLDAFSEIPGRVSIVCPTNPSFFEDLATREIFRYVYLRTGLLLPIVTKDKLELKGTSGILVAQKDRPLMKDFFDGAELATLGPQQFLLKTRSDDKERWVFITGGDFVGTLYGAYRFVEHLGVRFYLHGDVISDERITFELPTPDEHGKPLFNLRGIQPFHDFPEGPDWWNLDEYLAILSQLPKLRMNFFGLHTYPEGKPNAEPTTWIGLEGDIGLKGRVNFSYPSSYQNTLRGNWGYQARKTSEFALGGRNCLSAMFMAPRSCRITCRHRILSRAATTSSFVPARC